jgi:hypothetical protein
MAADGRILSCLIALMLMMIAAAIYAGRLWVMQTPR